MRWLPCAALAMACSGPAKTRTSTAATRIDELAASALRDGGAVGLSIVVMRGDKVVHARGYGFADRAHRVAATERSVYPLASLSKQYWAVGIAQLIEQHRLTADTPIADVLAPFPDRRVTVRHLLTQTSGLGDDAPDEDDVTFRDVPLAFDPGSWWHYSNRGALLARQVVERVTGVPWDRDLRERIALPLGLTSTTTCTFDNHVALHADEPLLTASAMTRIAFVCADALDVARFERGLDTGALLHAETVAEMRGSTQVAGVAMPYGWFTRIADLDGHRGYGHTGTFPGVSVAAFRFSSDDLTIVVLMNSSPKPGFKAHELVAPIARAELGLSAPDVHDREVSRAELDAITGSYLEDTTRATISPRDGHAWLTLVVDDKQVFDGALVSVGGRSFAGGPGGVNVDTLATFLPATGAATALLVGHRFLAGSLFRREAR